jgi:sodium-dependent dicarboxylate transporter 2/3/5
MDRPEIKTRSQEPPTLGAWLGRIGGPVLAIVIYGALPPEGLTDAARATAAIGALMAVWWMTEALPLPVTSLLPIVLFPLAGVFPIDKAAAPYADPFIFLFMGGFMLALAIERWNLHRRIALSTVLAVGTQPVRLVGGFMLAVAMLSMWISNTATTVMMLPIGLSVVHLVSERLKEQNDVGPRVDSNFAVCLLLGIAYASSIGGVCTLIGTPPNAFMAAYLSKTHHVSIGFGQWMLVAVPMAAIFLLIAWLVLTRVVFPIRMREIPGGRALIRGELAKLGSISRGEWTVAVVFGLTVLAWVTRKPLQGWKWFAELIPAIKGLNDAGIAMAGAVLLFVIPVDARRGVFVLDWETAKRLPWGVLLLFGGGLSLAEAVDKSHLAQWIGRQIPAHLDLFPLVVVATAVVILLTELTSNIATASAFLPILGSVALGIGIDPLLLVVPPAIAASCAFMLPVATPPNAIVFGSGQIRIAQMAKAGLWLNLVGIILITITTYTLGGWVLGIRF